MSRTGKYIKLQMRILIDAMHNLKGDIEILPDHSFCHSYIGRPERHLPSIGRDGVSKSQYNELVSTIKWNEFKDVKLIECL